MDGDQVFMKFNQPGATWEPVPYTWPSAIVALGGSYDLKLVAKDGTETVRVKTPVVEERKPKPHMGRRINRPCVKYFLPATPQNDLPSLCHSRCGTSHWAAALHL